jgi:hypothetical protein
MIKNFFYLILLLIVPFLFLSCGPSVEITMPVKMEKVHIDPEEEMASFKFQIKGNIFIDSIDDLEETQLKTLIDASKDLDNADFTIKIVSDETGNTYIKYFCGPIELGYSTEAISREMVFKMFPQEKEESKNDMIELDDPDESKTSKRLL